MTTLVLSIWDRIRLLLSTEGETWTCDQCQTVNSSSTTSCYRCGA